MCSITPEIDGKKICNFELNLHRVVKLLTDPPGSEEQCVELSLSFDNGKHSEKKLVKVSDLKNTEWDKIDYRAVYKPGFSKAKVKSYITDRILSILRDLPLSEVFLLTHPGMYKLNNIPVFCTGNEIILPSNSAKPEIEIRCNESLDINPLLSETDAAAEMLNLIALFPNPGRIIISQVLMCLMWQAYVDVWKAPSFCVFLYGESGTQKTTIASFLTQIYNRKEGIEQLTRFDASKASAVEMLMGLVDQVKVFDDLCPSESAHNRKIQEENLLEITRYIGDGTIPARLNGNKVRKGHPRCGVLFTGEYLIGKGSDAARLLPVEMTKPDTSALRYFQNQPLIVSTFYRNFIAWFLENYNQIVAYLKEWHAKYNKIDMRIHDRLREAHFYLNTAYSLLLEYCEEKRVLTEVDALRFHNSFIDILNQLVQKQNERVSSSADVYSKCDNVLDRIRELYHDHQFSLPQSKSQFIGEEYDGVIHDDCLCLHPKAFLRFFPNYDSEDIARKLDAEGALEKGNNGLKKKISTAHGNYFYCIPLSSLESECS